MCFWPEYVLDDINLYGIAEETVSDIHWLKGSNFN